MESFHESMVSYSFPFYEAKDIKVMSKLGEGGTGTVYSGELTVEGDKANCIIKQVSSKDYDTNHKYRKMYQDIESEVSIAHRFMGKTRHQIHLYGYSIFEEGSDVIIYLLMEKTRSQGDLRDYLSSKKLWSKLCKREYDSSLSNTAMYNLCDDGTKDYWDYTHSIKNKLSLIVSLCDAVQELHSFNIVHCDLKPNNMLCIKESHITLIDYGASVNMSRSRMIEGSCELGTPGYMAPELYDGWISYKADVYSIGVIMLEIWFGDIWPTNTDNYDRCRKYVLDYLKLLQKDNLALYTLVKKCVSTDPKQRPILKNIRANLDRILS